MTERNLYLPLTWNEEQKSMGVFIPVDKLPAEVQQEKSPLGPDFEHPLYLVEAISTFRMRYVVSAKSAEHACDTVVLEEAQELSQKHIDENIISVREINRLEYQQIFNQDNDYLSSWDTDKKFSMVHVVDYTNTYK